MTYQHGACWVVTENNEHILYSQSGEEIGCQSSCKTTSAVQEVNTAVVELVVNLAGSREEMMQKIKELNEQEEKWKREHPKPWHSTLTS